MSQDKNANSPLQNFGEIENMTFEDFKKLSKEEIVTNLIESLQYMISILLHDEINKKLFHILMGISTEDGGRNLTLNLISRWQSVLEHLSRENEEKFYELTFWFFKNFNELMKRNFEKHSLTYSLIRDTEEFQKILQ